MRLTRIPPGTHNSEHFVHANRRVDTVAPPSGPLTSTGTYSSEQYAQAHRRVDTVAPFSGPLTSIGMPTTTSYTLATEGTSVAYMPYANMLQSATRSFNYVSDGTKVSNSNSNSFACTVASCDTTIHVGSDNFTGPSSSTIYSNASPSLVTCTHSPAITPSHILANWQQIILPPPLVLLLITKPVRGLHVDRENKVISSQAL